MARNLKGRFATWLGLALVISGVGLALLGTLLAESLYDILVNTARYLPFAMGGIQMWLWSAECQPVNEVEVISDFSPKLFDRHAD